MRLRQCGIPVGAVLSFMACGAQAFGVSGHLIAGSIAESHLCARARAEVAELAGGETLAELGLWADRVRGDDAYSRSGPWHYLNIADGRSLAAYATPPEGDVLWAIAHFLAVLADSRRGPRERGEALRFVVHFVVDVHQPLHIGRAEDRGGNTVAVTFGTQRSNLHRFWDTDVLELDGLSTRDRARRLLRGIAEQDLDAGSGGPRAWAAESLGLRGEVYAFDTRDGRLDARYVAHALGIAEQRLSLAGLRLAATLNAIFCD